MDSLSYSVGVALAQNLKKQGFEDLDSEAFTLGVNDVLSGQPMRISAEEANAVIQKHLSERTAEQATEAAEAGKAFLTTNAQREEVTVRDSGLQYEVLERGSGAMPGPKSTVKTHYKGMLVDGTVFDSSYKRGEPATFPVNKVIKGWQETLQLMSEGSKWKIYVPFDLAYGEKGAGDAIPPFSALIFEIELLAIED